MKSYAAVDSIEGQHVRCELELLDLQESEHTSFWEKDCIMVDIPLEVVEQAVADVSEKDVLILEHDEGNVTHICGRDEAEMMRRIEEYRAICQG